MKRLGLAFSTAVVWLATLPAWAQQAGADGSAPPPPGPYYGRGMMWDGGWGYHHHMGGFGFFHPFLMILAIFILIAVCRRFWWRHRGYGGWHHAGMGPSSSALGILEERFVKGEVSKEEFEEKRKALRRGCF